MKESRNRPARILCGLSFSVLVLAGCGGGDNGQPSDGSQTSSPAAQPMSTDAQALLDQGNTAQRDGRYEEALEFYTDAMELAPGHPVPQFGALIASMATGDSTLADSLRGLLETSSPDLLEMVGPGGAMGDATAMPTNPHAALGGSRPSVTAGDSAMGALPPGHPALPEMVPDTMDPDTTGTGAR